MRTLLRRFDRHITSKVNAWPDSVRPIMEAATTLGHPIVVLAIAGALLWPDWELPGRAAAFGGIAIIVTILVSSLLKLLLRRKRPITYVIRRWFSTFSFPSGHTAGATAAYGVLASLGMMFASPVVAACVGVLAALLIVLVGISRVYLGAHYPSDVVAGWLIGFVGIAWLFVEVAIW